jgi:uncharacterized alkaline shock family protein YloU
MTEETRPPGMTTIAPDVLLTIARLATLDVKGVSKMSSTPGGVNRLFRRGHQSEGVQIEIEDKTVDADIYVILMKDVNIREVSRNIQNEIARAISEMVGMEVGHINIHIENIDYGLED